MPVPLSELISALAEPSAYPHPVANVELRQTHISLVFLAGEFVYKLKKPVDLGFVDFSTLARRKHFCEQEVRLNARLAPDVYLGLLPITRTEGRLEVGGSGEVVEWAVHMRRLPDDATLAARLARGSVEPSVITDLARRIAAFHAQADGGPEIARFGRFEVVARNARENFTQSQKHIGHSLSRQVFERLQSATERELAAQRRLIETRAAQGLPRDTHGDLRLEHIYLLEDSIAIIDCIEFSEQFRYADPVADIAFLAMELISQGRGDLAAQFADAYFAASADPTGRALLPFYVAYRAAVRAKVDGMKSLETEVPADERSAALARARGYWMQSLVELESAGQRPCLLLVGGLPGSGKSTLARQLERHCHFTVIRSDVVRKQLGGVAANSPATTTVSPFGQGLYTAEWNARTYAECLAQAERHLFLGERVLIDASFRDDEPRRRFAELAARWKVPVLWLVCQADEATVRGRLAMRRNDASDADWNIHQHSATAWQPPSGSIAPLARPIATDGDPTEALVLAQQALSDAGLWAQLPSNPGN